MLVMVARINPDSAMFTVVASRISDELHTEVVALTASTGLSKSTVIRNAIEAAIKDSKAKQPT